jgi:uncharacterized pyridoxamine 5'-phosphate oxidase family protein
MHGVLKNSFELTPILSILLSMTQQPNLGVLYLTVEDSIPHTIKNTNISKRLAGIL